jgi:hypothetical protein
LLRFWSSWPRAEVWGLLWEISSHHALGFKTSHLWVLFVNYDFETKGLNRASWPISPMQAQPKTAPIVQKSCGRNPGHEVEPALLSRYGCFQEDPGQYLWRMIWRAGPTSCFVAVISFSSSRSFPLSVLNSVSCNAQCQASFSTTIDHEMRKREAQPVTQNPIQG